MYEFKELHEWSDPIVDSSVGLIFNGIYVDAEIPEFMTLMVSGRGLVSRDISTTRATSRDGVIISDSTLPARIIRVRYKIEGSDNGHLRDVYERLNKLFHVKGEVEIGFKDDPDFYFVGSLIGISEPDESSNILIGELQFYCSKPFKYRNIDPVTGTSVIYPDSPQLYALKANLTFISSTNATLIQFRNSFNQAIAFGPVVSGRTYELRLAGDKPEILENGIRKMTLLSIESGVETFQIKPDLIYNLSTSGNFTMTFKELRL